MNCNKTNAKVDFNDFFLKLGNLNADGGKSKSHIIFHYGFYESDNFCFVMLKSE